MKTLTVLLILILGLGISNAQTLDDYFRIAAENNPGLQSKYKTFEASMQKVTQVSSLPDPNLSFGYFISPVETRVGPQKARFSLTQMFPWFGTLSAQKNAATLIAEAKYQEFIDTRNRLYYNVSAAYYPLYELQQIKVIEEKNIAILSTYKDIATSKFQNGKGSMVNVLRVDIMLKDATTNLSILEKKELPLKARFNTLLNREINESIVVSDSLSTTSLAMNYRKDSLLISNPLLEELNLKYQASEAQEKVAYKQGLPKLGVGLDYVIVGERTDMAVADNGQDVIMPMVTLSLPIFRGKYDAAKKEAILMKESYALQKEEVANRLVSAYEMTWFEVEKQKELIELYNDQIEESQQSLNLLFSSYGTSGRDFEEVLRMQQQLLKYQKLKAGAMSSYWIALAELDYITARKY